MFVLLTLLSLSCMPGGCQQKVAEKVTEEVAKKAIETQTGVKVNVGNGESVEVGGEMKDMLYPGAKVDATYENLGNKAVAMRTKDSPQKVMEYYIGKFGDPAVKATQEDGIFLSWKNGVTVLIGKEGDWTTVGLTKVSSQPR